MPCENIDCAQKFAELEARGKSNTHRIDALEKIQDTISRLVSAVEVIATEQKHITADIAKVDKKVDQACTRIEEIEKKPGKRWETVVTTAITILVGLALGYFLKQ